ncbi:MAG: TIGR04086 family membrane protein [Clostridiales bacterium]|nr:TIGR04086 family membrane protein [Clostridiales bacterium]
MPETKQMKNPLGKQIWVGLLMAVVLSLLFLGVGALLTVKEILPENAMSRWLYGSYGLAVFIGARFAVKRSEGGTLLPAAVVTVLLYALIWILGLTVFENGSFRNGGLWILLSVAAGGLLAGLLGRGKGKRKQSHKAGRKKLSEKKHGKNHKNR